jgi:hypothetical protein
MHILLKVATAILTVALFVPSISNAAVSTPFLDIQLFSGDSGATLTNTGNGGYDFDIDATALAIVTSGSTINIANQAFSLHGVFNTGNSLFAGSFDVAGGLLSGTFDNLSISQLSSGSYDFATDLTYTSGSLMGSLSGGRLEGIGSSSNLAAKLGPVVVPVPAAVWLFGSGLIGLAGVARRKS